MRRAVRVEATADGSFTLTFVGDGKPLRIWVPGADATKIIIADSLTNSPDRKMPMLVLRRKAAGTRFLTVLEPVHADDMVREVRVDKGDLVIRSDRGTRRVPVE